MLPSDELWAADEVLLKTSTRSYTVKDYDAFFKDIGFPEGSHVRRNVQGLTAPLPEHSPNVTLYCLHGSGVNTPESYTYPPGKFPDGTPSAVTNGDGDGTVNERSLKACENFKQIFKITTKDYIGVNHNGILSNEQAQNFIKSVLFQ
jgi:lysophospholipase-3